MSSNPPFQTRLPQPSAVLELLKPITWFPPMWAFACGAVSSGRSITESWLWVLAGVVLAGPLVCATSQAVNDWYDRDVDAINEPHRPIPSGRMPGNWGFIVAVTGSLVSFSFSLVLGEWVAYATLVGLFFAWIYSAPPLRLKQNGWWGNSAVALCYEGLPWITGAAVLLKSAPSTPMIIAALLYSLGAHGIMTLNDFKAIEGDRRMGIASLPVQLGVRGAAYLAWTLMAVAQLLVIACLIWWQCTGQALAVAMLLLAQFALARKFLREPIERATWFSGLAVIFYVSGMMVTALAIRSLQLGS
jgi:chlorophyll/bacteriochlorophyll a synthase